MELLKKYFELQAQIYKYFGYVEDWVVIPLDDETDNYWSLTGENHEDEVIYSPNKNSLNDYLDGKNDGDNCYSAEIYTQRFLPKWVYRGLDFTMVCVDTHTDGNKFLMVFDNKKEIKK